MRRIRTAGICLVVALVSVAGCEGTGGGRTIDASSGAPRQVQPLAELIAQSRPPIPDLPVPIGFKLDERKSRDYALAGARFVDHTYKGRANKLVVKRFYERQMPVNRWVLSTAMFVRGEILMDFEKETERCRIIIVRGSLFHPTYIKVQLWTSGPVRTPGQE